MCGIRGVTRRIKSAVSKQWVWIMILEQFWLMTGSRLWLCEGETEWRKRSLKGKKLRGQGIGWVVYRAWKSPWMMTGPWKQRQTTIRMNTQWEGVTGWSADNSKKETWEDDGPKLMSLQEARWQDHGLAALGNENHTRPSRSLGSAAGWSRMSPRGKSILRWDPGFCYNQEVQGESNK